MKEDVFRKAESNEPQLPLLGGHRHAPTLIRQWVEMLRRDKTESEDDLNRMLTLADDMEQFRAKRNGAAVAKPPETKAPAPPPSKND